MTYFPTEKRTLNLVLAEPAVGPGTYNYSLKAQHQSYAPFGSLLRQQTTVKEKSAVGPGMYEVGGSIIKPSITKYENNNIIIVKINDQGGSQFKSKTKRFCENTMGNIDPGPGSYQKTDQLTSKTRARSLTEKNRIGDKIRKVNKLVYQMRRQPTLESDKVAIESEEQSEISPSKSAKGVKWGLNKRERFSPIVRELFTQGNKAQILEDVIHQKEEKKKVKPSAPFASKSLKSHLEAQIYKTSNPFKVELRKLINYKDQTPGPGTYGSITQTPEMSKFQFFGSTVQRFAVADSATNEIGPGKYKIGFQNQEKPARYQAELNIDRHSYIPKNGQIPGPGCYELVPEAKQTSKETSFGSRIPRFEEGDKGKEENIESFEVFQVNEIYKKRMIKRDEDLKQKRHALHDHKNYFFTSNAQRFGSNQSLSNPVGQYDITQNDINSRAQKYKKSLRQLEQCNLFKPAFLSSINRFPEEKMEDCTHKDCWCLTKSVERQSFERESPVFLSTDKRTKVFEVKPQAPPVGCYSKDQSMIKGSFNFKFISQNSQKKKKSSMWKSRKAQADLLELQ